MGRAGGGGRTIRLFEGGDHALTRDSGEGRRRGCFVALLWGWLGEGVVRGRGSLVREEEKVELMREGGDLRGGEQVE